MYSIFQTAGDINVWFPIYSRHEGLPVTYRIHTKAPHISQWQGVGFTLTDTLHLHLTALQLPEESLCSTAPQKALNMLATSSVRHWRWIWSGLWTCGSWASSWWKVRLWRGCTPCGTRTAFNEKKESVQWIDVFFLIQHLFTQKKSCCQKMMDKNKWMDQVCKYNVDTWNECPILFLSPFHGATDENEFFIDDSYLPSRLMWLWAFLLVSASFIRNDLCDESSFLAKCCSSFFFLISFWYMKDFQGMTSEKGKTSKEWHQKKEHFLHYYNFFKTKCKPAKVFILSYLKKLKKKVRWLHCPELFSFGKVDVQDGSV